jgi:hypothetical protein
MVTARIRLASSLIGRLPPTNAQEAWMRSFALCVLILGCGDCSNNSSRPITLPLSAYPSCPSCQHAQLVVSQMLVPQTNAQAMQLGCDINGDGEVDNQLGKIVGALHAATMDVDPQAATNAAFQSGSLIMLYDIEYEPSPTMTQVAGLRAFLGAHDASDGLGAPAFYMGQGHFNVGREYGSGMGGSIPNGSGSFGPNDAVVQLSLFADEPVIVVPAQLSSLSGAFSATTIQNGKLCGAIDARMLRSMIDPQLADMFSASIKKGGLWAEPDFEPLVDSDHSCGTDPACVPSSPAPCHCVSASDMENSVFINSLFNPDLDLDPTQTNPSVTDRCDPTYFNDAFSFGVGITANAATFSLP